MKSELLLISHEISTHLGLGEDPTTPTGLVCAGIFKKALQEIPVSFQKAEPPAQAYGKPFGLSGFLGAEVAD